MRQITGSDRTFMSTHIAKGLEQLGIDVTPQTLGDELRRMDITIASSNDFTPPDPWADALKEHKRREQLPSTRWPEPKPRDQRPPSMTPPDPYAAAIEKMKREQR
jgi:hypothetical protein